MNRLFRAAQMKELDRIAIEEQDIPNLRLMENAAQALAGEAWELVRGQEPPGREGEEPRKSEPTAAPRFAVFCGMGNNGGDGLAAARFLMERGGEVRVWLVGDRNRLTPGTQEMERRLLESGGQVESYCPRDPQMLLWCASCDGLVDALFGIGLTREVTGDYRSAIELMNDLPAPTVSADIPSGVETDTGRMLGVAVKAQATVTFTAPKPGLYLGEGGPCAGRVSIHPIGIRQTVFADDDPAKGLRVGDPIFLFEGMDARLPQRRRTAHKGDFGKVYILAGSVGYTGAPMLAARAAVRSGAGLVTLGVPETVYTITAIKCDEAMVHPLPADQEGRLSPEGLHALLDRMKGKTAVLAGPGLGRGPGVDALVRGVLEQARCPVVLDADGLNTVAAHIDLLDGRRGYPLVLTPHDGEYARLGGNPYNPDRLEEARGFAERWGCILVLKGHRTVTAFPDGTAFVNTTGNPGMAKGGSGDVLAGMLVSLLGQGLDPKLAVPAAVWLHGAAGDLCAREKGEYAMTPSDMIEAIFKVIQEA